MKAIHDKGIDNNTLIVFDNDDGGTRITSNGPYRGFKSDYHNEGGIRVPFAARWPGKNKAGTASDEMVHAIDLFSTFCGLAGADTGKGLPLDGKDAWATLASQGPSPRDEIVHCLQVIRQGDWKFIEQGATYYQWPKQPLQLYDIRKDPYEKHNLAAEHPEVVAKLRARLAYHKQFGRDEEPPERIPGFPVAVYGEEENSRYGPEVKQKLKALGIA